MYGKGGVSVGWGRWCVCGGGRLEFLWLGFLCLGLLVVVAFLCVSVSLSLCLCVSVFLCLSAALFLPLVLFRRGKFLPQTVPCIYLYLNLCPVSISICIYALYLSLSESMPGIHRQPVLYLCVPKHAPPRLALPKPARYHQLYSTTNSTLSPTLLCSASISISMRTQAYPFPSSPCASNASSTPQNETAASRSMVIQSPSSLCVCVGVRSCKCRECGRGRSRRVCRLGVRVGWE